MEGMLNTCNWTAEKLEIWGLEFLNNNFVDMYKAAAYRKMLRCKNKD
jgi:hypothetical protein